MRVERLYRSLPHFLLVGLAGVSLIKCTRRDGGTQAADVGSRDLEASVEGAAPPDATPPVSGVDATDAYGAMGPKWDSGGPTPWECSRAAPTALDAAERPDASDVLGMNWDFRTLMPLGAEAIMMAAQAPQSDIVRKSVDSAEVLSLWGEYRSVRSSPSVRGVCGGINARAVVRFHLSDGVERWVAVGRECPIMQTEDHVCHALDRALFRRVVESLGVRASIAGAKHDPTMAKFL